MMSPKRRALTLNSYRMIFRLSQISKRSYVHAVVANTATGFALLSIPKAKTNSIGKTSWVTLALSVLILIGMLFASGYILSYAQPALYQLGKLSIGQGLSIVAALLLIWRNRVGANYLNTFKENQDRLSFSNLNLEVN